MITTFEEYKYSDNEVINEKVPVICTELSTTKKSKRWDNDKLLGDFTVGKLYTVFHVTHYENWVSCDILDNNNENIYLKQLTAEPDKNNHRWFIKKYIEKYSENGAKFSGLEEDILKYGSPEAIKEYQRIKSTERFDL